MFQIYLSKMQNRKGLGWNFDEDALAFFICLFVSKHLLLPRYMPITQCAMFEMYQSCIFLVPSLYLVPIDTPLWLLSGLSLSVQSGAFFAQADCFQRCTSRCLESKRVQATLFLDPPTHQLLNLNLNRDRADMKLYVVFKKPQLIFKILMIQIYEYFLVF